jgi:hypothetical protein
MNRTLIIQEVIDRLIESKVKFVAIGGFAKYLHGTTTEINDLDFFIPKELNSSECILHFLKLFDRNVKLEAYNFKRILRINYKTLKIDLLPKLDGINNEKAFLDSQEIMFQHSPIRILRLKEINQNIQHVKNQII